MEAKLPCLGPEDVRPAPVYVYDFQFVSCKACISKCFEMFSHTQNERAISSTLAFLLWPSSEEFNFRAFMYDFGFKKQTTNTRIFLRFCAFSLSSIVYHLDLLWVLILFTGELNKSQKHWKKKLEIIENPSTSTKHHQGITQTPPQSSLRSFVLFLHPESLTCEAPTFSFQRLSGSDPHVGVEMQSTGEAAGGVPGRIGRRWLRRSESVWLRRGNIREFSTIVW